MERIEASRRISYSNHLILFLWGKSLLIFIDSFSRILEIIISVYGNHIGSVFKWLVIILTLKKFNRLLRITLKTPIASGKGRDFLTDSTRRSEENNEVKFTTILQKTTSFPLSLSLNILSFCQFYFPIKC